MLIISQLNFIVSKSYTGCSLNIVFFRRFYYIFRTLFSLDVSACTHTRQVEHQRCSRTGRVKKNSKNTIVNEHPVPMITCKVEPQPVVTNLFPHIRPHFLSQRSNGLVSDFRMRGQYILLCIYHKSPPTALSSSGIKYQFCY